MASSARIEGHLKQDLECPDQKRAPKADGSTGEELTPLRLLDIVGAFHDSRYRQRRLGLPRTFTDTDAGRGRCGVDAVVLPEAVKGHLGVYPLGRPPTHLLDEFS